MSFSEAGCSSSQTLVGIGKLQGVAHGNSIGSGGRNYRWIKTVGLRLRMFRGSKGFHHVMPDTHPRKETTLEGPRFMSPPCTGALCVSFSPRTHCPQMERLPRLLPHSIFLPRLSFSLFPAALCWPLPFPLRGPRWSLRRFLSSLPESFLFLSGWLTC